HRNTLKHNDFLPPAPHALSRDCPKYSRLMGGQISNAFPLHTSQIKIYNYPDRAGAGLRLRQSLAARYDK
ncbi:MAG: hypothetical protein ACREFR_12785, partial [Limisphaerales bacterium]